VSFVNTPTVKIHIRKVPPTGWIEGIDLRHYQFCEGNVYELGPRLAQLLIVWGYAGLDRRAKDRDQATDNSPSP
jgi:hypothetical protein